MPAPGRHRAGDAIRGASAMTPPTPAEPGPSARLGSPPTRRRTVRATCPGRPRSSVALADVAAAVSEAMANGHPLAAADIASAVGTSRRTLSRLVAVPWPDYLARVLPPAFRRIPDDPVMRPTEQPDPIVQCMHCHLWDSRSSMTAFDKLGRTTAFVHRSDLHSRCLGPQPVRPAVHVMTAAPHGLREAA
jgi:hypothetical protein